MVQRSEGRFGYLLPYIMTCSHLGMSACEDPEDIQQLSELYLVGKRIMEFGSEEERTWYARRVVADHYDLLEFERGDIEMECDEVFAYVLYRGNFFWDPPGY